MLGPKSIGLCIFVYTSILKSVPQPHPVTFLQGHASWSVTRSWLHWPLGWEGDWAFPEESLSTVRHRQLCSRPQSLGFWPGRCTCPALCLAASMNVALYAGIAGGLAAAIIVTGIVVYCCCCRGKDEAKDTRQ